MSIIATEPSHRNFRFPVIFLGCSILLISLYYSLSPSFIESVIVRLFAVLPGTFILNALTPDFVVSSQGTRIMSPIANLNVLKGCEGTEALLLLYAGIVAMLRPWRTSLLALVAGTVLVFALNQIRIVSLYFIVAYQPDYFELVHGFLAPLLMIASLALFFLNWSRVDFERQRNL